MTDGYYYDTCPICKGSGIDPIETLRSAEEVPVECIECDGSGEIMRYNEE